MRQHFGLIREFVQEVFAPHSQSQITIKNTSQASKTDASIESAQTKATGLSQLQESISISTQAPKVPLDPNPKDSRLKDPNALESSLGNSTISQSLSPDSTPPQPIESKKLKPSDLILYSTQEIYPDRISDAVYEEVPWDRGNIEQEEGVTQGSQNPLSQEAFNELNPSVSNLPQKDYMTQAFKDKNQALIDGIKQHFGVTSMIVEAPTHNDS